jgi:PAS domain S-box-containing protein
MTAGHFADRSVFDDGSELQSAYRCVLDSAPDAVFVVDPEGVVTWVNAAAETLLGLPANRLLKRPFSALLCDPREWERGLALLTPGERLCDRTLELRRVDGQPLRVSVSASCVSYGPGSGAATLLYARDLRERLQAERLLEARNEELEHCVQTMSHDLRSPLVALLGFSRLLRQDYESQLDETGRHFVDRIEQAGRTMEDLIHDLLELSRIERPGPSRAPVDPRSVLLQLQAELKPRLEAGGVGIEIPSSPPLVHCDRTRLYQLFSNLIGNALDHMGSCDDPRITVEVEDQGSHHCVRVRDSGRGIAPEHHERIFQVFQSLGPRDDGQRGTGIGLAIVRKIAESHGGRAWVESRPGRGATFHVTLPKQ